MKDFIASLPYYSPLDKFIEKLDELIDPHTSVNAINLPVVNTQLGLDLFFSIFKCERCGKCCTRPDPMVPENNFIAYLPSEYEYAKKCLSKDIIKKHFQPLEFGYKCCYPCPFYANSGCSIYKHRPLVCTAYPIDASTFENKTEHLVVDTSCPGALKATRLIYISDYLAKNNLLGKVEKQND